MQTDSKVYPGLACQRRLYLLGAEISTLPLFISILKMDEEFTYKACKKLFGFGFDSYTLGEVKHAFNTSEALTPEDVFSEKIGTNSEVKRAIFAYVSPGKIFAQVETQSLDKWFTIKSYPKYQIRNIKHTADSSTVSREDIICTQETRKEHYELLRVTDKRVTLHIPFRVGMVILLKMMCPSSKKEYYEYIDPSIFPKNMYDVKKWTQFLPMETLIKNKLFPKPGDLIRRALCWQMRKRTGKPITGDEYDNMVQET